MRVTHSFLPQMLREELGLRQNTGKSFAKGSYMALQALLSAFSLHQALGGIPGAFSLLC